MLVKFHEPLGTTVRQEGEGELGAAADLTVCLSVGLLAAAGTGGLARLVGPLKSRFHPGGAEEGADEGSISTSPSPSLNRVFRGGLDSALGTGGFQVGFVILPGTCPFSSVFGRLGLDRCRSNKNRLVAALKPPPLRPLEYCVSACSKLLTSRPTLLVLFSGPRWWWWWSSSAAAAVPTGAGGGRWRGMVAVTTLASLGTLGAGGLVGESFSRLFLMSEPITKSWLCGMRRMVVVERRRRERSGKPR